MKRRLCSGCGFPTDNADGVCDVCAPIGDRRCPHCEMKIGHGGRCDVCREYYWRKDVNETDESSMEFLTGA